MLKWAGAKAATWQGNSPWAKEMLNRVRAKIDFDLAEFEDFMNCSWSTYSCFWVSLGFLCNATTEAFHRHYSI